MPMSVEAALSLSLCEPPSSDWLPHCGRAVFRPRLPHTFENGQKAIRENEPENNYGYSVRNRKIEVFTLQFSQTKKVSGAE